MTFEQLRLKHPRLVYKRAGVLQRSGIVELTYEFLLEPDITLRSVVTLPYSGTMDEEKFMPYVFHLGLVEAISYWKLSCPRELVIEAGVLDGEQIRFWYDVFIHGLGEFFYQNQIDFTVKDFLRISCSPGVFSPEKTAVDTKKQQPDNSVPSNDLLLVGGGKDSAVTLGMMKQSDRTLQTMVLNPTQAALDNIREAGFPPPLMVARVIDPKLSELNRSGYLNGHTPFSAYLAFLGILVAVLHSNENVIVSNEKSADEGNVVYRGMEVNHQYSKSFRFESMFRQYCAYSFENAANYFSILRPLNDMQIGLIFSTFPQFFTTFRSCNAGSKTGVWCGTCAKCAFTYLCLSPFLSREQMMISFGADLFANPKIIEHIKALVGLTPVKPFECVGTRNEAKLAVTLTVEKYLNESLEVPEGLLKIKSDVGLSPQDVTELRRVVMDDWGDTYNLPPEHVSLLRSTWQTASSAGNIYANK